jgi:carboxylesterase type B
MYSLFLAGFAATTLASDLAWNVGQAARTSSGVVQGHAAKWPANSAVSEYLGIPYAVPPVGPLRWAPPKPYTLNGTFHADKYAR